MDYCAQLHLFLKNVAILFQKREKEGTKGKMKKKFSVLMSLYCKERPSDVRECFDSLLRQTVLADEWVIVEDGALTEELYTLLEEYQEKYPSLIKRVPLEKNHGLGKALNIGVKECSYDLIARMDTDDIAREDRFEKQLKMFEENPTLDICGSHIKEFYDMPDKVVTSRIVPLTHEEIKKFQKRRTAFNHMTVMYKKAKVLEAGNYQHALYVEDSLLWVKMIMAGAVCANIDDYLVLVRTGGDMYHRRGGLAYFKEYRLGIKTIYKTGYLSFKDYVVVLSAKFMVAIIPNSARQWIYERLLRKKAYDS